jgi:hypothetical protein
MLIEEAGLQGAFIPESSRIVWMDFLSTYFRVQQCFGTVVGNIDLLKRGSSRALRLLGVPRDDGHLPLSEKGLFF